MLDSFTDTKFRGDCISKTQKVPELKSFGVALTSPVSPLNQMWMLSAVCSECRRVPGAGGMCLRALETHKEPHPCKLPDVEIW